MVQVSYPGVYVEELRSGVRTISGVATSVTAFIGYTARGLDHRAKRIFSFADFERNFGGLASDSELSYAVKHFFDNGGGEAVIVRVPKNDNATEIALADAAAVEADAAKDEADAAAATAKADADADPTDVALAAASATAAQAASDAADALVTAEADLETATTAGSAAAEIVLLDASSSGASALKLTALSRGEWANAVVVEVDYYDSINKKTYSDAKAFNLTLTDLGTGVSEEFSNVTMDSTKSNYVVAVVNDEDSGSELVEAEVPDSSAGRPLETGTAGSDITLSAVLNDKNYAIKITSDLPSGTIADVSVTVIEAGETLPTSVLGLCRLLERKINLALEDVEGADGAAVRCELSSSGKGIRIVADFDADLSAYDASLTLADGDTDSALAALGLDSTSVNVAKYWLGKGRTVLAQSGASEGRDGTLLPKTADIIGKESEFSGIYALDKIDLFNLLSIPDATRASPGNPSKLDSTVSPNDIFAAAMTYCQKRRAFLLVDPPPEVDDVDSATDWKSSGLAVHEENGAAYFPRLRLSDPLNDFQPRTFAPSGVIAGLYARIDGSRGVWKAPAGTEATLTGVQSPVYKLTDAENGALNPLGLNCFRTFPIYGNVAWGARTLVGADDEGSEWKYVPVRRLALYLEESLFRGTKWVVFEPNDEPLWAQIRLNITAFMHTLFRQGAFQGKTPKEAYLVKCDKETTTQDDINRGIVNILVGFAPLKPAEFVIIKIQQLAGQTQA